VAVLAAFALALCVIVAQLSADPAAGSAHAAAEPAAGSAHAAAEPAADIAPDAADAEPPLVLGNPYASPMNIANATLNKGVSHPVSIPMFADAPGCITEWILWGRFGYSGGNYSKGDGGTYRVDIVADDGSGLPDRDQVLDSAMFEPKLQPFPFDPDVTPTDAERRPFNDQNFVVSFTDDAELEACVRAGTLVHLVISNTHAAPHNNYLSLNGPYLLDSSGDDAADNQNTFEAFEHCPDCHIAFARRIGKSTPDAAAADTWLPFPDSYPWASRYVYMPYQCLKLDNGLMIGNDNKYGATGLGDYKIDDEPRITGAREYIQTIDYSASPTIAQNRFSGPIKISFYAAKFAGDDPLQVLLNGQVIGDVAMDLNSPGGTNRGGENDASVFDWYSIESETGLSSTGQNTLTFRTTADAEYKVAMTVETDGDGCNTDRYDGFLQYSEDGGATLDQFTYNEPVNGANSATYVQASFYIQELRPTCNGLIATIDMNVAGASGRGTAGDDVIVGTSGPDQIDGLGGDDTICGGDGNDRIDGGAGDDYVSGGPGYDAIVGGDGNDSLSGDDANDRVRGNRGDDRVLGGAGDDFVEGGFGDDYIDGGDGKDQVLGYVGDDQLYGGDGNDYLEGGAGEDRIFGNRGDDALHGGAGDDYLRGNQDDDHVRGGPGDDFVEGGFGDDRLFGDAGNDQLIGHDGDDRLDGGIGRDYGEGGDGLDACSSGVMRTCEGSLAGDDEAAW